MAAPANKTIGDLNGKWVMVGPEMHTLPERSTGFASAHCAMLSDPILTTAAPTLSDSPEPGLALQGVGYLTRKAVGLATVTLHVKQYTDAEGTPHIDIEQMATGGIKGTSEHRTIDSTFREHSDWLFGKVKARSFFVTAESLIAKIKEELGGDEFLGKDWLEGQEEQTGPDGALHLVNWVEAEAGWTAAQVWGFQTIGGERRYARNIVVKKGDKIIELRLVYDYVPE
ncbi:hypothetical protein SCUP515_01374 [Seiridium cupressi]